MQEEILEEPRRLTRKERRILRQQGKIVKQTTNSEKLNFTLEQLRPLTATQKRVFESFRRDKDIMMHGCAGTGKSFVALGLALEQVLNDHEKYKKIIIFRSSVATRDIGFLKGNAKEKVKVYEAAYNQICTKLFNRGDAYEYLKRRGLIEFESSSFLRGLTYDNCIMIVDETENHNFHELDTIYTRIGTDSKIIFSGDHSQTDFSKQWEKNGLLSFMEIMKQLDNVDFIEFGENDIVRSDKVKNYIIAKNRLGL